MKMLSLFECPLSLRRLIVSPVIVFANHVVRPETTQLVISLCEELEAHNGLFA